MHRGNRLDQTEPDQSSRFFFLVVGNGFEAVQTARFAVWTVGGLVLNQTVQENNKKNYYYKNIIIGIPSYLLFTLFYLYFLLLFI